MDNVISGLQQKLQNLKAQGQANEKSNGETVITADFKNTLRKFSESQATTEQSPRKTVANKPKTDLKGQNNQNGIKIIDGKEEFTINFEEESRIASKVSNRS